MASVRSCWAKDVMASVDRRAVELSSCKLGGVVVTMARERSGGAFGLSFCSLRDSHDRSIGQAIAFSRLKAFEGRELGRFIGFVPWELHGVGALLQAVSQLAESHPAFFEKRQDVLRDVAERQAEFKLKTQSKVVKQG